MAQNKRPVFTKAMLGYTPREVDLYIDRMNERYLAALADNSKLRRRVESLQAELERARADVRAAEVSCDVGHLVELIKNEASRHSEALGDIISALSAQSDAVSGASCGASHELPCTAAEIDEADGFVPLEDDVPENTQATSGQTVPSDIDSEPDNESEDVIRYLEVEPYGETEDAVEIAEADFDSEKSSLEPTDLSEDAPVGGNLFDADDAFEPFAEEYGPHELDDASIFAAPDEIFIDADRVSEGFDSAEDFNNIKGSATALGEDVFIDADRLGGNASATVGDATSAEAAENAESTENSEAMENAEGLETAEDDANADGEADMASAAQRTASLDFYTDTVVRDGESFDPMTLAHRRTLTRRPTLEDFMRPLGDGEQPVTGR